PRLQLWLSRFGGVGNRRAVIGRNGFLFYTPGLAHLAGPSFLDPDAIRTREQDARNDGGAMHADPRPAIFAFHAALARRGIRLVVFPVPDKTMLQPMQLHGRGDAGRGMAVARNPGWRAFAEELRGHGIALFDPTPSRIVPGEPPHFLIQDTHWTPQWM